VRAALRAAGHPEDALTVVDGDALVGGGEAAAIDLFERAPDTTAILAYNDLMAIGALRALRHRGRRVPLDASVVGFDDVPVAAFVDPALTTISQRTEEMGRWAVERLLGDDAAGATTVRLPVDLHIRDSTGPAPR
jgi:LacI family transcriptional regulator